MTPLHWACEHNHVDIVKILLRAGAKIDIKSKVQLFIIFFLLLSISHFINQFLNSYFPLCPCFPNSKIQIQTQTSLVDSINMLLSSVSSNTSKSHLICALTFHPKFRVHVVSHNYVSRIMCYAWLNSSHAHF